MLSDKPKPEMVRSPDQGLAGDRSRSADLSPRFENYLRIKQGVGAEALRAAGLPVAEDLSYDAYAAALRAAKAGARAQSPMLAPDSEPHPSQALPGPAKQAARARGPIAWCVGLSVAFFAGMVINEIMRDWHSSGAPDLSPVATATVTAEAASAAAASPAPLLLLQPRIAEADHLPRPSPVASLPLAPVQPAFEPRVAAAAQPVTLLPKPRPAAKVAEPAPSPVVRAQATTARGQSQPTTFWDQLTDLLAKNKSSEATAKQRWRNKSEDR